MKNLQKGQTVISVFMWAIGLMATAGLGLNVTNMNANAKQDDNISKINRETGELTTDVKYIKQAVDDLKAIQIEQLRAQR